MPEQKQPSHATGKNPKEQQRDKNEDSRKHSPTPKEQEESLDRTLEDSFPASDPPSSIPDPDADAA
jgi:hypothetical protein